MKRKEAPRTNEDLLRQKGLRATRQRLAVLTALMEVGEPVAVEVLTRSRRNHFDLATAYRTLDSFVNVGIAKRIELAQGRALYEIATEHHHHAVCTTCGRIEDIDACLPRGINNRVCNTSGFASIEDHALEFFGTCMPCAKNLA